MTPQGFSPTTRAAYWRHFDRAGHRGAYGDRPTSSIRLPRRYANPGRRGSIVETHGRHDPCVGIRATPIAEAMLALVLIDHALRHRANAATSSVRRRASEFSTGQNCSIGRG